MINFVQHPEIAMNKKEYDPKIHKAIYKYDYRAIFEKIACDEWPASATYRELILNDLFFIILFVMQIEKSNHPFVVQACRDVEDGPKTMTIDIWAREHFKTTISVAESLQKRLKEPDGCTAFFSYARPAAKIRLRSIKNLCEQSDLLKQCFPEVLWQNPQSEAPKWSEDDGLILKRKNASRRESTFEAWGLLEGMPIGRHYEDRNYDDIETDDIRESPDMLDKCFSKFEMSDNLGVTDGGTERIWGTYYSHFGPMVRISKKKDITGNLMYFTRIKTATDDDTISGKPVLLSQERLDKLKMSEHFNSQQLCNPTPTTEMKLDFRLFQPIDPKKIPRDIYKFMVIDQAGDDSQNKQRGDLWAYGVLGIRPEADDIGASDVYLLDVEADTMTHAEGINGIVQMYVRNGMILQTGVEKVGLSTTEIHIASALRMRGRNLSVEQKTLVLLRPTGRSKEYRVQSALQWPLNNGKLFYSTHISAQYISAIEEEMQKFPFYHVDILDMMAYGYDMFKDFRFPSYRKDNIVYLANKYGQVDCSQVFM